MTIILYVFGSERVNINLNLQQKWKNNAKYYINVIVFTDLQARYREETDPSIC